MKGNGYTMSPKTQVAPAGTRTVLGTAMISDGIKEVPYPESAARLINLAIENGWGFDDGLPARTSGDGTPYVRVLIGREPGQNALTHDASPGVQFHAVWHLTSGKDKRWVKPCVYVRTSLSDGWSAVETVGMVRSTIASNPVKLPDVFVSENN